MTKLQDLAALGQAVWLDTFRRSLITSGALQKWIDLGVRGLTFNPYIFESTVAGSADYDEALKALADEEKPADEICELLILEDVRRAADLFGPIYDQTKGLDGYVCLDVAPALIRDTEGTIAEARRLCALLERKNVMINVPATLAGIPVIEALTAEGINVNATLIFSVTRCEAVAGAYIAGIEKRLAAGGDVSRVASVASFSISPVDRAVDRALVGAGAGDTAGLASKTAIANAVLAHARFFERFDEERFRALAKKGARPQRMLFTGTGAWNPVLADTLYTDSLIGPNTVNAMPPATLTAFLDHGRVAPTLQEGQGEAKNQLAALEGKSIDLELIAKKLEDDGVDGFMKSFVSLLSSIDEKREKLVAGRRQRQMSSSLGKDQYGVEDALSKIRDEQMIQRIWAHDHTVWKPDPAEITNRLGWLHSVEVMQGNLERIQDLVGEVRADGYTHALLLGMGGSSLAPEVFRMTFGVQPGHLDLSVLDSTDPGAVCALAESLDPARTLYIVSTKSGGTVETASFFKYFYNQAAGALGAEEAGRHFVAITDPGSKLADLAEKHRFRAVFLNDSNIGGRYSVFSYFGMVPAALVGVDLKLLLDRAMAMVCNCDGCNCPVDGDNLGARLGAIMGQLGAAGRDKVTLFTSPAIASFGNWVEQLIAESTGKEGKGILPVVGGPVGPPDAYGDDRLFVHLRLEGDDTQDGSVQTLEEQGHPVVRLLLKDLYDLGGQFFLFEMATVVAGALMQINPFDQPNVESAKIGAREMVAAYHREGALPELASTLEGEGMKVITDVEAGTPAESILAFIRQAVPGAYISIQAYVQPTAEMDQALDRLRTRLRDWTRLAVTVGYGPRFLHSTGQLHKGDGGKGLFIQIIDDARVDASIPDEAGADASSMTFGVLKQAQALGDREALLDAGRQVIRFHMGPDALAGLNFLTEALHQI